MLIALLVVLGVDLIVVVIVAAIVIGRRRWLKRQPGEFAGTIRVTSGDLHGLSPKWKRGSGRWVRDVLVWNHGTFMFRTELVPVDQCSGEHRARTSELKRLGDAPVVAELACANAMIEIAAHAEDRVKLAGPFSRTEPGT